MKIRELVALYQKWGWRDFFGHALRRVSEFAIPLVSYSQAGEDIIVDFLFQSLGIRPSYLELGTNLPKFGNNTYKFYRSGCCGVLIEADPSLIPLIRRVRRRDKVLHLGVGVDGDMTKKFYLFTCSAMNTFDEREARVREQSGAAQIRSVIDVKMASVNSIIGQNFDHTPDFLSIDIEGMDLAVLETLDFGRYPIPVICAETCVYSETHVKAKDHSIAEFLKEKGYFVYADTYINTIFVNEKWFLSR